MTKAMDMDRRFERHWSLLQAEKEVIYPLFSLPEIAFFDRKKCWFRNEFVYAKVSLRWLKSGPKTVCDKF